MSIVIGVGRSGTTFVTQILQEYFNYNNINTKVISNHSYMNVSQDSPVFIVIRDLRDVMVSRWRIILSEKNKYAQVETRKMTKHEIDEELKDGSTLNIQAKSILNFVKDNEKINEKIIKIYYEKMMKDKLYLYNQLTKVYENFSLDLYKKFITKFSIINNKKRSNKLLNFSEWDKHNIHGHHIYKGEVGGWYKYIPNKYHHIVNEKLKYFLEEFGYE